MGAGAGCGVETRAGDRMERDEAFTAFVMAHRARLLRAAYLICGDASRAEDITQIALSKLYVAWHRVEGSHESFARMIIARTAVDESRRPWRREVSVADHGELAVVDAAGNTAIRMTLRRALLMLPLRQRQVVVLRHYWGLTVQETAAMLALSPGTVKSHASRALKRLNVLLVLEEVRD